MGAEEEEGECTKRLRGIVHEAERSEGMDRVQTELGKLMGHDEQTLLSLWQGWRWDDAKGGWLDPDLCAKARREEVEHTRRHKVYTRVLRETCFRETGKAPISTGPVELTKGSQGSPTYARGGSRRTSRPTRWSAIGR